MRYNIYIIKKNINTYIIHILYIQCNKSIVKNYKTVHLVL